VSAVVKPFRRLIFALVLTGVGCHGQVPAGTPLSPELARRVEVLIRQKTNVSPEYSIVIGPKVKSDIPNFDRVDVTFTNGNQKSKPLPFLVSTDGKTLAQFTTYDISQDPRSLVSAANRPSRGGPPDAPVTIVLFDDLECPFCAKMHAQLFPALQDRYKDKVRIVYRDFPLEQHPWAMHAAIDSNCLATQSPKAYWNLVDYVHAHASELGGDEKSLAKATETLDKLTLDEGKREKADESVLSACVKKQDQAPIKASMDVATSLGISATPALFINGERLEGALPMEWVDRMIDGALTAEGVTPPPPLVTTPASATPAEAAKNGGSK